MRIRPLLAAAALVCLTASEAAAAPFITSGVLNNSDPTMPVVFISTPNCVGQGVFPVHYDSYAFTVDAPGNYTLTLSSVTGVTSLYLFHGSFTPSGAFSTCVAGDNIPPITFTEALTAATTYFAVPFDDSFNQGGGSYTLEIDGPGTVSLVGRSVPEPGLALLAVTGLGAAWRRRRALSSANALG